MDTIASLPDELLESIFCLVMQQDASTAMRRHKYFFIPKYSPIKGWDPCRDPVFTRRHPKGWVHHPPSRVLRSTIGTLIKAFIRIRPELMTKDSILKAYCRNNTLTAVMEPNPEPGVQPEFMIMRGTFDTQGELEKHVRRLSIHASQMGCAKDIDETIEHVEAVLSRCPKLVEVVLRVTGSIFFSDADAQESWETLAAIEKFRQMPGRTFKISCAVP